MFMTKLHYFFQKSVKKGDDTMIKSCFEDHFASFFTHEKFRKIKVQILKVS